NKTRTEAVITLLLYVALGLQTADEAAAGADRPDHMLAGDRIPSRLWPPWPPAGAESSTRENTRSRVSSFILLTGNKDDVAVARLVRLPARISADRIHAAINRRYS